MFANNFKWLQNGQNVHIWQNHLNHTFYYPSGYCGLWVCIFWIFWTTLDLIVHICNNCCFYSKKFYIFRQNYPETRFAFFLMFKFVCCCFIAGLPDSVFCTLFQAEYNETGLLLQFIFSNGNFDRFYGLLLLSMYITATNFV